MSENVNKYLDSTGIRYLWNKAANLYQKKETGKGLSTNDFTDDEKIKLADLENYELPAASNNALGGIKIGNGLSIDANGVVSTEYNPEMGVNFETIANLPDTLEGYGITDAATQDTVNGVIQEVNAAQSDITDIKGDISGINNNIVGINADIGGVRGDIDEIRDDIEEVRTSANKAIHYIGQVETVANLDSIENPNDGDMYDVKENGANYAWSSKDNRWDSLGMKFKIESLSNYELDLITGSATTETSLRALISEGGNAQLGGNMALEEALVVTKDTTLDLNNFTLSGNVDGYLLVADGAKLTLTGGNVNTAKRVAQAENGGEIIVQSGGYTSGDVAFSALGEGSKVTFNGGSITAVEGGIGAFDKGEIEINGGKIEISDNFAVFTNGSANRGENVITMNGGTVIGNIESNGYTACGVYIANNDAFTMNGGTIIGHGGTGILMRGGTVVINDGIVIAEASQNRPAGSAGWIGDKKKNMTQSAVIFDEASNYPGAPGMSLTINGGKFTGVANSVEVLSNAEEPAVYISGGTFNPALNN